MLTDLGRAFAELRDDAAVRCDRDGAPPVFSAAPTRLKAACRPRSAQAMATRSRNSGGSSSGQHHLEGLEQITIAAVNGPVTAAGAHTACISCSRREALFWIRR